MNETEIRALGFEPWYGGEQPADWDGGGCMFECGYAWVPHNPETAFDKRNLIIGYKKKEIPMEYPEWVRKRAYELVYGGSGWLAVDRVGSAFMKHILDHEQPPVDPDLELARKHYLEWSGSSSLSIEDAILAAIKEARNA